MGGPGTIEYYPLGMALVINQTPDIQEQIADLLDALRRLQDQEVAVEVRFITVAEAFFERIGLDFDVNIKTDRDTTQYEPQIVTQQFKPFGLRQRLQPEDTFVAGLTPARHVHAATWTSRSGTSSFQQAIPPFGGFPNIPGGNGGLSLGLAFLSDIQVFMFMEAAQGDQRTNVMQAPKLTLFNGQTVDDQRHRPAVLRDQRARWSRPAASSCSCRRTRRSRLGVHPDDPGGGLGRPALRPAEPDADADEPGRRRSCRCSRSRRSSRRCSRAGPSGPADPVHAVHPAADRSTRSRVQTTVSVPDGGTVLLGGLKTLSEGRNEFGPPILSKIPYINRLFKNVGYGREAQSLMIMVTPRIIINEEEEFEQTGASAKAPWPRRPSTRQLTGNEGRRGAG